MHFLNWENYESFREILNTNVYNQNKIVKILSHNAWKPINGIPEDIEIIQRLTGTYDEIADISWFSAFCVLNAINPISSIILTGMTVYTEIDFEFERKIFEEITNIGYEPIVRN